MLINVKIFDFITIIVLYSYYQIYINNMANIKKYKTSKMIHFQCDGESAEQMEHYCKKRNESQTSFINKSIKNRLNLVKRAQL